MSLSPDEVQARIDRVREIQSAFSPEKVVAAVTRLFELDRVPGLEDEFTFPAFEKPTRQRIFGGQVIAQALVAAARTVDPGKTAHSLHAYFLRGGDEAKPLHFRVHRDFDGRSFANRRVVVRQDGKVIFNLTASFHAPEPGATHQAPMPDVLPPEECAELVENLAGLQAGVAFECLREEQQTHGAHERREVLLEASSIGGRNQRHNSILRP